MKKSVFALVAALVLGSALIPCGGQTTTPMPERLPSLEPITTENADKLHLLRTLVIPGYKKVAIGQCSVAFSPDGRFLVAACEENQVPVWDVQSGSIRHLLYEIPQHIVACAFSPDGKSLACGGFDKTIALWNPETGERIKSPGSHVGPIWELDFSPDGQRLVSCSLLNGIRLRGLARGEMGGGRGSGELSQRGLPS